MGAQSTPAKQLNQIDKCSCGHRGALVSRTDGRTDRPSYRDARTHLKKRNDDDDDDSFVCVICLCVCV